MVRSLLVSALPLCLMLAACSAEDSAKVKEESPRPAVMVQPRVAEARQDIYPGEVHARFEPALAFRIDGKISRRLVDVGERVTRGQALAKLDAENLKLQLDSARAQLAAAEADQRMAASELERHRKLLDEKLISASRFDAVQGRYDTSNAQLKRARAQLDLARNRVGYAVLKSPRDGVIARRLAEAGQVVAAGQAVFTLAADGEREVRIDLPEQDIGLFEVGQTLAVELWSRPGQPFPGHIRALSPAATSDSRTYEARVAFDNRVANAQLGQSARVFVRHTGDKRPLSLPLSAVTADAGEPFVWVLDPTQLTLHKTPVEIGPYGEERVPIMAGLQADDWVVAAGAHLVREGMRVQPVDRMNRPIDPERNLARQDTPLK